jgi:hypothetical protein
MQTSEQGLKALRTTSMNCILVSVCCQKSLSTQIPRLLNHMISAVSFPQHGGKGWVGSESTEAYTYKRHPEMHASIEGGLRPQG